MLPSTIVRGPKWGSRARGGGGPPVGVVLRDRDRQVPPSRSAALDAAAAEVKVLAYRSPNTNAYVERFVQAVQQECLDRSIVFGQQHLDHVLAEYLEQ